MIALSVGWEFPFWVFLMGDSIIWLVICWSWVSVGRLVFLRGWYSVMGAFTNSGFHIVVSWAESVRASAWSLMITVGVIREFPLRILFMNHPILWLIMTWARVFVGRTKLLRWWNSIVRAFTNCSFHIIISWSKFVRAIDRSIMVAVKIVRELPLRRLQVNESPIGLIMGWPWVLIVWADISWGRDTVVGALSNFRFQVVWSRTDQLNWSV